MGTALALSGSIGYSYKPDILPLGPGHTLQLHPLLEHLIELVESSGVGGLHDTGNCVSTSVINVHGHSSESE